MPFPTLLALGIGQAAVGGLFSGLQQSSANRSSRNQQEAQYRANLAQWEYNRETARRQYQFDTQSVRLQARNLRDQLNYQEGTSEQAWRYQMQISAFDYANQQRASNRSRQTAQQQLEFNNVAYDYALQDTARWEREQDLMLDFEESTTMLNYRFAQRGEALNAQQAEAALQERRGMGQLGQQRAYVESLEAMGQAQARGAMGVSSIKNATASIARTGAATAALIQDVLSAENTYGLSMEAVNLKLEQLNDNFYLDRAQIAASRVSLEGQALALRNRALLERRQADINALASVMLEPMVPPAIPRPLELPRPRLQMPIAFDAQMWEGVRPERNIVPGASPVLAGLGQFASGAFNAAINSYNPSDRSFT